MLAPPPGVGAPSSGKSWIRHCGATELFVKFNFKSKRENTRNAHARDVTSKFRYELLFYFILFYFFNFKHFIFHIISPLAIPSHFHFRRMMCVSQHLFSFYRLKVCLHVTKFSLSPIFSRLLLTGWITAWIGPSPIMDRITDRYF